jgi:hypothetical protein
MFLQVVNIFANFLNFFSSVGTFFQSFSEGRVAATQILRLIDEVYKSTFMFHVDYYIGTRCKYK